MAGIKFDITGDNRNVLDAFKGVQNGVRQTQQVVEESGLSIEDMFKRIGAAVGVAFTFDQAKNFVRSVMETRGQFQQLEISFSTMLQSEEKAKELMDQLVETAAKTPFDLQGVAQGAKQLLAYGIAADEVNETITRLGDIAAGLSIPIGDLVYLYGTTMTQGRMFTQDLRQFMGRGIPMAEELAKQFGVTKNEVAGLVTAGQVGADAVKQAIWNMTNEGSRFGGLMSEQSKTITGQISSIEDAFDTMLNDIGKNNEGLINDGLAGVSFLIDNYEKVGKILLQLVAIYGSYKAAVIAYVAIQKVHATWIALEQTAHLQNALATEAEIAAKGKATVATVVLDKATKALNATMLANPYVMVTAGIMTLVSAIYLFGNRTDEAAEAQKKLDEATRNLKSEIASERANIDTLFNKLRNAKEGTDEYKKVKDQILGQYGKYLQGLSDEISTLKDVEGAYKAVTKAAREASIARGREAALKDVQDTYGKNYASNIEKIQNVLVKKVGTDKAGQYLRQVQNELEKTGTISEATTRKLRAASGDDIKYGWIENLKYNEKYLNDYTKLVEQRFQFEDETGKKANESKKKRNKQAIEEERKNLQGQLEALEQSEAIGKKGAELKKKIADLDKELKAYNTSGKSGSSAANDAASRRQKEFELNLKQAEDQAAQSQATRDAIEQARISAIKNDGERERKAQEEQHRLNLQAISDKEEEMKKALYAYNKSVWENKNKNKSRKYSDTEEGKAGWEAVSLSEDQIKELKALRDKENADYERSIRDRYQESLRAMRDYMKEYGSIEQQRLAITQEYEQKIANKEGNAIQKAALRKQMEQELEALGAKALEEQLDWETVFGDLSRLSTSALQDIKEKLRQTLDAKDITVENAKVLAEKIREIEDTITDKSDFWASLLPALRERKRLAAEAAQADSMAAAAQKEAAGAAVKQMNARIAMERALHDAGKNVDVNSIDLTMSADEFITKIGLDPASEAASNVRERFAELATTTTDLKAAQEQAAYAQRNATNLNSLLSGGGSMKTFFNDLFNFDGMSPTEIAALAARNAKSMAETVDRLGVGETAFGEAVHGFSEGVGGLQSAMESLKSGDLFGAVNGILDMAAGFGKMGINAITGDGNEDDLEKEISKLSESQERLAKSIDYFAGKIKDAGSTNEESIDYYRRAYAAEEEWEEKQRKKIDDRAREYATFGYGFFGLGGKSSFNASMAGAGWEGWKVFSDVLKANAGKMGVTHDEVMGSGLWDLSPEELELLQHFAPKEWEALFNGDGHRNPEDLVNEYIERAGERERLTSSLNEKLTGYSWDSFLDSYKSMLKNLDSTTEDFASHINELISNAIIESFVTGPEVKGRIQALYKMIADAAGVDSEGGTELTEREIAGIKKANDELAEYMLSWRETAKAAGLISASGSSDKSASAMGLEKISYEQADQIQGQLTAIQIAQGQGNATAELILMNIQTMSDMIQPGMSELRSLAITRNEYLLDIKKSNREMLKTFSEKIDNVERAIKDLN